ncbi:MAG: acyl-CoA dehydrogenase family protein [Actinomycetota bacterium]
MNFDFSDEQYAVRDLARDVFEREWSAARLRERWQSSGVADDRVWKALAGVGITGLTVPEEHGGFGGDHTDLVLVLEEAGRAGVPDPLVETVAVAAPLLAEAGTDDQRSEWLPRIASGDVRAAVQVGDDPSVASADEAAFVIIQRVEGLHLVTTDAISIRAVASEDRARRLYTIVANTSPTTLLTSEGSAVDRMRSRGAAATASLLNGVSIRLVEMTLDHVKARHQFGRPIGSFQAVKHKLASMHVAVESARSAAWYAAYALARDLPEATLAAAVAKAATNDAAAVIGHEALQCHGGIGFTWEHDLHLWLKRALSLQASFGTTRQHRWQAARALIERSGA